jgi:hypothetical protein
MKNNNASEFFNVFGDLVGRFAEEFGNTSNSNSNSNSNSSSSSRSSSSEQGNSCGGNFYEKAAKMQAKMAKAYYDELISQGFSEKQALKLVGMMNSNGRRH